MEQLVSHRPPIPEAQLRRLQPPAAPAQCAACEAETRTEIALDQPCASRLRRIAQSEAWPQTFGRPSDGNDGRNHCAGGDRQSRIAPKRDQDAGGHAAAGQNTGNANSSARSAKAQLRREENRAMPTALASPCTNPRHRRVGAGSEVNFLG